MGRKQRIGITMQDYAERIGCSVSAVAKAKKAGRIVLFEDGSIDAEASDVRWKQSTNPARPKGTRGLAHLEQKAVPTAAVDAARELVGGTAPADGGMTFLEARTANEILKVHVGKLALAKARGEVLPARKTLAKVEELARRTRDAWQTWPARISAEMAAELSVSPHSMQVALEAAVAKQLEAMADLSISLAERD